MNPMDTLTFEQGTVLLWRESGYPEIGSRLLVPDKIFRQDGRVIRAARYIGWSPLPTRPGLRPMAELTEADGWVLARWKRTKANGHPGIIVKRIPHDGEPVFSDGRAEEGWYFADSFDGWTPLPAEMRGEE